MTTHFHRGRNENLIVEIIKVIPGTSKKKKGGGGKEVGLKEQSMIVFKIKLWQIIWSEAGGGIPAFHRIWWKQFSFLSTLKLKGKPRCPKSGPQPLFGSDARESKHSSRNSLSMMAHHDEVLFFKFQPQIKELERNPSGFCNKVIPVDLKH